MTNSDTNVNKPQPTETIVLGGGCFWCTEAVFKELRGVISVMPGYGGGSASSIKIPTYETVSTGTTGYAEVTKIEFDPSRISSHDLLTVFFATHDPTTQNRQGADVGPQYRSIILYTSSEQKQQAEDFITELQKDGVEAVTELKSLDQFYPAEDYHRNYFEKNPDKAYCQLVINPKLEKLQQKFSELLKTNSR